MKLELQVIATSSIKRKKPWPRIAWVGEGRESILLIDRQRLSILYIPSGKTKRRLANLHPLLPEVSLINLSNNGHFICCLLRSGDVLLWHKDTNILKFVQGLPVFSASPSNAGNSSTNAETQIYISDTGSELLVVPPSGGCVYLWQKGRGESVLSLESNVIEGQWALIRAPEKVSMPRAGSGVSNLSAVFVLDDVLGRSCCCSFVFLEGSVIVVTSVWLRWNNPDNTPYSGNNLRCDWSCLKYQVPTGQPESHMLKMPESLVASHTRDGRLLAVAVNCSCSHDNCMLYVSMVSDVVVVSDMKGCGAKNPVSGQAARMYWVEDMHWTWDDLFLVCMIGQGSLCMLPRLGEPVLLRTYGQTMDMGPRYYLPILPLVSIPGMEQRNDFLRQQFTIAPHPRLPLFLCSDGYVVTAFQLPGEMSCLNLLKGLTMEAGTLLKHVKVKRRFSQVMADLSPGHEQYRNNLRDMGSRPGHEMAEQHSMLYEFERPENEAALDEDSDDELLTLVKPQYQGIPEQGQVIIGDAGNMNTTQELLETDMQSTDSAEAIEKAYSVLTHAWTLAASHSGLWTQHHDDATVHLMRHICSLITIIVNCDSETAKRLSKTDSVPIARVRLSYALAVLRQFISLLRLDSISCNLMLTALHMTHNILKIFMKVFHSGKQGSQLHSLHGCYMLLLYMERSLANIYDREKNSNTSDLSFGNYSEAYEPSMFCLSQLRSNSGNSEYSASHSANNEETSNDRVTYLAVKHSCSSISPKGNDRLPGRLLPTWRMLYKHVVREWRKVLSTSEMDDSMWTLRKMLVALQCKLHLLGFNVTSRKMCRVKSAKRLFIEGCPIPATQSWLQQLNKFKDLPEHRLSHLLHSVLYTLILQKELRQVIEFVEILIRHEDTQSAAALFRQDQQTKLSVLSLVHQKTPPDVLDPPPSYIRSIAVLQLVQSLGRFMAAYFTNSTAFVYPPHTPHRIPPLHLQTPIDDRILPLYSGHLSAVISQAGLDRVWTVERCMEYLVISGLFSEAVWFSLRLGDWKTAFVIASVCEHRLEWHKKRSCTEDFLKYMRLPEKLSAGAIMKEQMQSVFSSVLSESEPGAVRDDKPIAPEASDLKRFVHDMVLGCTVMGVNMTPWLLDSLISRAKTLFSQLSPVVPSGFYLPAPPVYCPQPALPAKENCSEEVYAEFLLRNEIYQLLQCILLVLSSSNCLLPSARWYITLVLQAVDMAASEKRQEFEFSKEDMAFLHEFMEDVKSPFQGEENDPIIHDVLAAFRDICSLLWMAHARDNLSRTVRAKSMLAEQLFQDSNEGDRAEWVSKCSNCLMWATSLSVFCNFLSGQEDIYGLLLSIIMELPASVEVAMTLAVHLPDAEDLPPDTESKLQVLLKSWQGVFLQGERTPRGSIKVEGHPGKAPRGASLSVFYRKQAERVRQTLKKKQKMFGMYVAQVFASEESQQGVDNGINFVGARPFESEPEFLNFLDMFYAICLNKEVEKVNEKRHIKPFLVPFMEEIRLQELDSMAFKAVANLQKRQNLSSNQSTPFGLSLQLSKLLTKGQPSDTQPASKTRGRGLFRSRSFNDVLVDWGSQSRGPQMGLVVDQRSASHSALDSVELEPNKRTPRDHYRQKLRSRSATRQKETIAQVSVPLQRSPSVESQLSQEERASDPLSKPLFSAALLDAMVFGPKYNQVESLVDWLSMWSGKHHKLNYPEKLTYSPAIHINMHRRLMVYALWEIEHFYYPRWGPSRPIQVQDEKLQEQAAASTPDLRKLPSSTEKQKKKTKKTKRKPPKSSRAINSDTGRRFVTSPEEEERQRNIHEFVDLLDDSEEHKTPPKSKKQSQPKRQMLFTPEEKKDAQEDHVQPRYFAYEAKKDAQEDHVQPTEPRHFAYEETLPPKIENNTIKETVVPQSVASESSLNVSSLNEEDLKTSPQQKHAVQVDTPDAVITELKPVVLEEKPDMKNKLDQVDGGQLNDLASTLRDIIRHEMTRVMKAQYEGIMNGLGALDGEENAPLIDKKPLNKKRHRTPKADETRDKSSTDFDVTPLPSDDPLTLSELERQPLVEPTKQSDIPSKEIHQFHNPLGPQGLNGLSTHPPHSPYTSNHPPLLRLPNNSQRVHFPSLVSPPEPRVVWHGPSTQSLPRMPSMQQQRHLPDEVPVRDTTGLPAFRSSAPNSRHPHNESNNGQFPLLHLPGRPRMFSHIEDQNGVPRLVPPQEVMEFQRQKKMLEADKQHEDAKMKERIAQMTPNSSISGQHSGDRRKKSARHADMGKEKEEMRSEVQVQRSVKRPPKKAEVKDKEKGEEEEEEQEDVDEESVEVHPGHALTPGLFDEYLKKDPNEEDKSKETFAEVQLKVASMLKATRTNEVKRDTSMQTDPTLVHAGTTFNKDSGTDPIQEAIDSYTRARRDLGAGGLLPPELFLGLQFPQQHSDSEASNRAFINVVDIQGRALDDLIANITERETQVGQGRAEDLKAGEQQLLKEETVSAGADTDYPDDNIQMLGPDSVTERVLDRSTDNLMKADKISGRSAQVKTKRVIRGRLDDMGVQIDSMERMAQKMEDEYKNTKLLVHTIESLGEAINPSEAVEPSSKVLLRHSPPTKEKPEKKPLKPSDVRRLRLEDRGATPMESGVAKASEHSQDNLTPEERLREIRSHLNRKAKRKEELTGDLEYAEDGNDVDANGFVKEVEPSSLKISSRTGWSDDLRVSKEELENLISEVTPWNEKTERRNEDEKQQLQKYIAQKRAERMRQFRLKQEALRERETRPFQMTADAAKLSTKELEERENQRMREKASRETEFALRRQHLANKMMGDLLSDRLDLPSNPPVVSEKVPAKKRSTSKRASKSPKHSSPIRSKEKGLPNMVLDEFSEVGASHDYMWIPSKDQKVRWSDDTLIDDIQTGTDSFMGAYTRQLEHMQTDTWESERPSTAPSVARREPVKQSPIQEESDSTSVPQAKSFTELVRMQRPEVTRRGKGFKTQPISYTERLAKLSGTYTHTSDNAKDNRDVDGSTRTPGVNNTGVRRAPRIVKTYTQRLQEMKQARRASGPVTWQPRPFARVSNKSHQPVKTRVKRRKPSRPLTYAEQLQRLQPPKELYRTTQGADFALTTQGGQRRRRHKPPHKPKTYAQQLQELQPHKAMPQGQQKTAAHSRPTEPQVFRSSLSKGLRTRPYRDPYIEDDEVSISSVTSAWNLDDNIRKLIYDDQISYTEGMSVATTGGDMSDLAELEQLAGEDYAARVSISELAEVKSMSSGSIMSFIDWDQVEDLIADIQ